MGSEFPSRTSPVSTVTIQGLLQGEPQQGDRGRKTLTKGPDLRVTIVFWTVTLLPFLHTPHPHPCQEFIVSVRGTE